MPMTSGPRIVGESPMRETPYQLRSGGVSSYGGPSNSDVSNARHEELRK